MRVRWDWPYFEKACAALYGCESSCFGQCVSHMQPHPTSWHMCGTWLYKFRPLPGQRRSHAGRMAGPHATCPGRCTAAHDSSVAGDGRVLACTSPCLVIACSPPLISGCPAQARQPSSSSSSSSCSGLLTPGTSCPATPPGMRSDVEALGTARFCS